MTSRWFPSLGHQPQSKAARAGLERKDAATQRAAAGRGFTYAGQPYVPPGTDVDRMVRDGYEKVIWAFRGVDAIADKLSSWPIGCREGFDPETWKQIKNDPILPMLNQYSNQIERSAKYFRYRVISQLLLSKKGVFVEVIPNRAMGFSALNLLPPAYTSIVPDPDKFIGGFEVAVPGQEKVPLPAYDPDKRAGVIWIRKPHPTDPYSSITPLEAAGISLDLDFYARMYNRNFLLNDGRAGQLVAIKGGLSPEDAAEIKARFQPGIGGAGRTTVVEADDVSVTDTAVSPRDAQYAELRKITKDDLLIALGTPESVLGNASGRTFDNADAEKENWLDVTVQPLGNVFEAGFDVLTAGGWGDDRQLFHDTSGEPVLQRAKQKRIDVARKDFTEGRISLDEFRDIAELEVLNTPGSRVVWIAAAGKVPIGGEDGDAEAAGELKPIAAAPPAGPGDPNAAPAAAGAGGLEGFDAELEQLMAGGAGGGGGSGGALQSDQSAPTAMTVAGADLGLETKKFNPDQPRYPSGHPKGGQFMDAGDTALWLAGKPLKGGFSSAGVANPNPGSTASPALSPGIHGGAVRFTSSPDPKVRAAAAVITYPQGYAYPRVLGAPPAQQLAGPKGTKLVSLRKGDVIEYAQPGQAREPWAVVGAKRVSGGDIQLELVNGAGDVIKIQHPGSVTAPAIARTPHPTAVADAKRVIAAEAARLGAGAPATPNAPAAPAAAPSSATTPPPAGGWVSTQVLAGAVFVHPATGSTLTVKPNGSSTVTSQNGHSNPASLAVTRGALGPGGSWHLQSQGRGAVVPLARPAKAPTPSPAAPAPVAPQPPAASSAPSAPAAPAPQFNYALFPVAAPGTQVFVNQTAGKHVYVDPQGGTQVFDASGRRTSSSSDVKLARGQQVRGWTQVASGPYLAGSQQRTGARAAAPAPVAAAVAPTPAPVAAPVVPVVPSSPAPAVAGHPVLTIPANYPYPVVAGAPVASALAAPKPIKAASLRKGDVIQFTGFPVTVISVDRSTGTVTGRNLNGKTVTVASGSGQHLALARTPHPTVVAAARRQQSSGTGATPSAPQATPAAPAAPAGPVAGPSPVGVAQPGARTTPAVTGGQAIRAARQHGAAQQNGYQPIPGQTYATPGGDVVVVHSDGSGTVHPISAAPHDITAVDVETALQPGTSYVPVGPQFTTSKYSIDVGRHTNGHGDAVDVNPDGTGTLHLASGQSRTLTEDGVDQALNSSGIQAPYLFSLAGPVPYKGRYAAPAGAPAPAAAPAAPAGPTPPPGGTWAGSGQVVPGAVFTLPATGATLRIGPRGGGVITVGGQTRGMSSASAQSRLNKRNSPWQLVTPGPTAQVAAAATPTPAAAPAPSSPAPAAPATPGALPFTRHVNTPADAFMNHTALQAGQTFKSHNGNTIVVQPDGTLLWTAGPRSRAQTRTRTVGVSVLRNAKNGYASHTGPDIDTPGAAHAAAARKAARLAAIPPPGTAVAGVPPNGAVYPAAATGVVSPVTGSALARGMTVRHGGDDYVVTDVVDLGGGRRQVWGYRPGHDDPNTVTQSAATKKWHQGVIIDEKGRGAGWQVVQPAVVPANNVPAGATARAHDPALGAASKTTSVGASTGTTYDVVHQMVAADQLKAGDSFLLNGREGEGLFVVTSVGQGPNGLAVFGHAGTDTTATPGHLFYANPGGKGMRQVRVQVDGAPAPLPVVPKPTPPQAAAAIERNDISDASSQAKVRGIMTGPPPRLSGLPSVTSTGDLRMGHLMEMRGYNAHPDVVSEADLDQFVADGEIELWRGIRGDSSGSLAEDYRSGRHYPGGNGGTMYGTGTYAAYGDGHKSGSSGGGDAIGFAKNYGASGSMVRMTLKADARIAEFDQMYQDMRASRDPNVAAMAQMGTAGVGHYAVYMGYDAIRKSHAYDSSHSTTNRDNWDYGFLIIVNRSAMRISEKTYVASPSGYRGTNPPPKTYSQARHKMNSRTAKHEESVDYRIKGMS